MAETYLYNIQTLTPKRGDIVIKNALGALPKYISYETYNSTDFATRWSGYEYIGNVVDVIGGEALVARKDNASYKLIDIAWHYLSGYTLDGTQRTGVISARFASNSWASNIDKTITYTATTMAELVTALNTAFAADSDFTAQNWKAEIVDSTIRLCYSNIDYRQMAYNTASSGFALTGACPEFIANSNMKRKHGGYSSEGAISNMARAIAYFTNDNSSTAYNPSSDVTSIKRTYPVCLPAYLGTSSYQSDHCALLRSTYGEGRDGWLNFMKSCLPTYPTDFGTMGKHNGKEITAELVSHTTTVSSTTTTCSPAAAYCYNAPASLNYVADGEFWLPTAEEVARILDGVQYGTSSSRSADALNAGILAAGGSAISNSSIIWSCCRCNSYYAWFASGNGGFFVSGGMYGAHLCVPVSLYKVAE